tara:strand:- start:76 stop:432 length:357 start_codon:yes stop_codon:yes gene_type:complete
MTLNKEINHLITTIQQSLQDRLKERNDYIHNLKWEHASQLDKLKEENKELKDNVKLLLEDKSRLTQKCNDLNNEIIWEWNEEVIGLKEEISELKEEINKLKMQIGEPFVPYTRPIHLG